MHAKTIIYMLLVILLQAIMVLNAEDGIAEFGTVKRGSQCGEDVIIRDLTLTAVVPRPVWKLYGCGKYFKVTCAKGKDPCGKEGSFVILQAIDYTNKGGRYITYNLTFEAFYAIADLSSNRIDIRLTAIEEPEYADVANTSDDELDAYIASTSDDELENVNTSYKHPYEYTTSEYTTSDEDVISTSDKDAYEYSTSENDPYEYTTSDEDVISTNDKDAYEYEYSTSEKDVSTSEEKK